MTFIWNVPNGCCIANADNVETAITLVVQEKMRQLTNVCSVEQYIKLVYVNNVTEQLRKTLVAIEPIILNNNEALLGNSHVVKSR
jgi:hypothetical protein